MKRQSLISFILISIIAVWPVIHFFLSKPRDTGFSPWKLMGFGMFTEPTVYRTHISAILVAPGEPFGEGATADMDLAQYLNFKAWRGFDLRKEPFEVGYFEKGHVTYLNASEALGDVAAGRSLGGGAPGALFHTKVTDVQCLYNSKRYLRNLAQKLIEVNHRPVDRLVFLISKPRINLKDNYHYASTCAFVFKNDEVKQSGCFMTDKIAGATIIKELNL